MAHKSSSGSSHGKSSHKKTKSHKPSASQTHHDEDEVIETTATAVETEDSSEESMNHQTAAAEDSAETSGDHQTEGQNSSSETQEEEVRVEFPYSDLVRAYVPKAMEMADKVATDWKKDGSFNNLGIDNPYANMAVSLG